MKNRYIYPALFEKEKSGYTVSFPDLDGCFTEGATLEEALDEAKEALLCYVADIAEKDLPAPSRPSSIRTSKKDDFVALVDLDVAAYRQKHMTNKVKKTLTLTQWVNDMAEERHINFSSTLEEALKVKLGV